MRLFESVKYAFKAYKEKVRQGILYSIVLGVLSLLLITIPIIGAIIVALLWPTVLRKIADEWELSVESMESSEARKAALIIIAVPMILDSIISFSGLMEGSFLLYIIVLVIEFLITLTLVFLFLYSLCALVLGKEKRIVVNVKKSVLIMMLITILILMFNITSLIVSAIPMIGTIIEMILSFLVFPVIGALAMLHYTRSL